MLDLLSGPEHAAAREAVARTHFHVGTEDLVADVVRRLSADFADRVKLVDEKAVAARRGDTGFVVETDRGQAFHGGAVILSTGVMDRQPRVKLTTKSVKVVVRRAVERDGRLRVSGASAGRSPATSPVRSRSSDFPSHGRPLKPSEGSSR